MSLCNEGKVACVAFGLFSCISFTMLYYLMDDDPAQRYSTAVFMLFPVATLQLASFLPYSDESKRAGFIGIVFGASVATTLASSNYLNLSVYFVCLSLFHISEYLLVAFYNPDKLNLDSFLLNHSTEYTLAVVASWAEYFVGVYFWPGYKQFGIVAVIGLLVSFFGQVLRKVAMVTAEGSFTHLVQYKKNSKHTLVTNGVYAYARHPAYVGWFYWSIGSQILLCNPLCTVGYAVASWKFFNDRIPDEEYYLIRFFQDDYINYMQQTGTGLPFICGLEKDIARLRKDE